MDIHTLSNLSSEVLAVALAKAQAREADEFQAARLARRPKCRCGAPATRFCETEVTYMYGTIEDNGYTLRRGYLRGDDRTSEYPPNGESGPMSTSVWVCCDKDECLDRDWAEMDEFNFRQEVS